MLLPPRLKTLLPKEQKPPKRKRPRWHRMRRMRDPCLPRKRLPQKPTNPAFRLPSLKKS